MLVFLIFMCNTKIEQNSVSCMKNPPLIPQCFRIIKFPNHEELKKSIKIMETFKNYGIKLWNSSIKFSINEENLKDVLNDFEIKFDKNQLEKMKKYLIVYHENQFLEVTVQKI